MNVEKSNPTIEQLYEDYQRKGLSVNDLHYLRVITNDEPSVFRRLAQRRLFGEPFAYLTGKVKFFDRKFKIDRRVYVPNRETESLVKAVLEDVQFNSSVLDVGTGSGVIAITIAKEKSGINVIGSDICPSALEVAIENARFHKIDIPFFESFYVNDLKIEEPSHIVADMPYGDERFTLPSIDVREFKHMPPHACFHPRGILKAYVELIDSIQRKGWKTKLFFETGRVGKEEVKEIIPEGLEWNYNQTENYSFTVVEF